ncbi:MAG: hypothetical protein ACRD0I_06660 [Acidimicrobiales bacterium]
MKAERRWLNQSQPQTLQIAVILLYLNAGLSLILGGFLFVPLLLLNLATIAAGYGIANEKKWAYILGLIVALIPLVPVVYDLFSGGLGLLGGNSILNIMFEVALVALLIHPQSRDYQRIWFK